MSESNETKLPEPTLINLEGLKGAVLASVPVRDELGYTRNLALPCTDEGVRFDTLLDAFGLDTLFVSFESQVAQDSPAQAEYEAGNGCAGWTPVAPEGEDWRLAEVYDTEDGAYAMFVRETPPPALISRHQARGAALAAPPNFERMFNAACVDLGLVNEALGLHPDDGGAAPILAAIADLKSSAASDKHQAELERSKRVVKMLSEVIQNQVVGNQAAWIEWQHGKGAEAAMGWINNGLEGPGQIPEKNASYGTEAQAWYDANCADPMPQCFCGRPSNIGWMGQGFCCDAHHQQSKAMGQQEPPAGGGA